MVESLIRVFNVKVIETQKELIFEFPYRRCDAWEKLKDEIKNMEGAKFHREPSPHWRAKNSQRNQWVLRLLNGEDAYSPYKMALLNVDPNRPCLYKHQKEALNFVLTRKQCILAGEMGTGKTLVLIEAMEHVRPESVWYVAPRFALIQIKILFQEWKSQVTPVFMSYDEMKKIVVNWPSGQKAPQMVIFDESAYLKTPSSQRSACAYHLACGARVDHTDPYIILASGAPAPKSPKDWWHQCEIACPGYLRESSIYDFERRLALIEKETSFAGGSYPKLITWWDDPNKCAVCGQYADSVSHIKSLETKREEIKAGLAGLLDIKPPSKMLHDFKPSVNEVEKFAKRLSGLALVQFKKDCLSELPDKIYRVIKLQPNEKTKRAAALILRSSATTIEALTRLRELSDGFQYSYEPSGEFETCKRCHGTTEIEEGGLKYVCTSCKDGKSEIVKRIASRVFCPKDEALREIMQECGDRIVIFGGFTESIERIVDLCKRENWQVIRVDGSTRTLPNECWTTNEYFCHPIQAFQNVKEYSDPIAFVAHAATAKTSLTLTASNTIVYYSNTFNADDRIQSEDRIHRIGMDTNKGANIFDLIHLDSDWYVRENLREKRVLQSITLGELQQYMVEHETSILQ